MYAIICPFFVYIKKNCLRCEDRTTYFKNINERKNFMFKNHCQDFEYIHHCPYAKKLTEEYEKGDD